VDPLPGFAPDPEAATDTSVRQTGRGPLRGILDVRLDADIAQDDGGRGRRREGKPRPHVAEDDVHGQDDRSQNRDSDMASPISRRQAGNHLDHGQNMARIASAMMPPV